MASLGISDKPAILAVAYLLIVQLGFLAVLFRNFFVASQGYELEGLAPFVLGLMGTTMTILWGGWQIHTMRRRLATSSSLERPAIHATFHRTRELMSSIVARSALQRDVALYYHITNERALHVTERNQGPDRLVVGLGRVMSAEHQPQLMEALLGHEVSHLEMRQTRFETWARFSLLLYVRLSAAVLATMVILAAYLGPAVEENGRAIASLFPPSNSRALMAFVLPITFQVCISSAVVTFAYFLLIRREILHDLRATQLAGHFALIRRCFQPECQAIRGKPFLERLREIWRDSRGLHPTACRRAQALQRQDWVLLDTGLYPLMAGFFISTPLLLAGPIAPVFEWDEHVRNWVATPIGGLLVYAVMRSDIGRFSAQRIQGKPWLVSLIRYSAFAAAGSMIVGSIIVLRYSVVRAGWTQAALYVFEVQTPRIFAEMLFVFCLLLVGSYLVALRRLIQGRHGRRPARTWMAESGLALAIVSAFAVKSIPFTAVAAFLFALVLGSALLWAVAAAVRSRCDACGARRLDAMALRQSCSKCGQTHPLVPSFPAAEPCRPITHP